MALEQEIKEFLKELHEGVVVGVAGPGRFDGPPSLDPEYVVKNGKSIISFAIPLDTQAIYDYLSKKTSIPHNMDQIRTNQRSIHMSLKLKKFLEEKGHKAGTIGCNIRYRRDPDVFSTNPRFSHRYGAYVSGVAAPGFSGNAMTKEYGAGVVLNTVITDVVLESDPILDPRHFYDKVCAHCQACKGACVAKMFDAEKEEYALINGQLYPRGQKRSIDLCNVSCSGLHALSPDKKYSTWARTWVPDWTGVEPAAATKEDKKKLRKQLFSSFGTVKDMAARLQPIFDTYSKPWPEGYFEDRNRFPNYEDLPGETEGQKLSAFREVLQNILGYHIGDPNGQSCSNCNLVCGATPEESLKRFHMLNTSGIVCYGENNEPIIAKTYEEAVELRKKYEYQIPKEVKKEFWALQAINIFKYFGIDRHTWKHKKKYQKRLATAVAQAGKD